MTALLCEENESEQLKKYFVILIWSEVGIFFQSNRSAKSLAERLGEKEQQKEQRNWRNNLNLSRFFFFLTISIKLTTYSVVSLFVGFFFFLFRFGCLGFSYVWFKLNAFQILTCFLCDIKIVKSPDLDLRILLKKLWSSRQPQLLWIFQLGTRKFVNLPGDSGRIRIRKWLCFQENPYVCGMSLYAYSGRFF